MEKRQQLTHDTERGQPKHNTIQTKTESEIHPCKLVEIYSL